MNFTSIRSILNTIIPIALGTAIYAFGLHYFIIPNRLMEGGLTGIALLLNYSLNLPPSLTSLLLNIPLFIIGWRLIGRATMIYTVVGTVLLSFFLWMMELAIELKWIIPFYSEEDYLLAALYAGVTLGSGLGIVFRFGGTTGGVDIIARIINKHTGSSIGQVILLFDVLVLTASLFYISKEKVLYTLVAVFISTRVIDFIQEGAYAAKAFTIISDDAEHIARVVTMELERGVTLFPAKGAYSNQNKQVVYCIVNRQETRKLKTLVRRIDPRAFMIISDVHDVLGEGFRPE